MTIELKPCPFCGEIPELPNGDGTQYEIECEGCGQAMASIQISDLMTIDERTVDDFINYRYGEQYIKRAKNEAIKLWNTRVSDHQNELLLAQVEELLGIIETALSNKWDTPSGVLFPMNVVKARSALARAPQQSLDSLKARIENETIAACVDVVEDNRGSYPDAVNALWNIPRKYQPSTKADK